MPDDMSMIPYGGNLDVVLLVPQFSLLPPFARLIMTME